MELNITGPQIFYEIPVLGGIKITESHVNSLFIILLVYVICKILTSSLKLVPTTKRQIVAEFLVEIDPFHITEQTLYKKNSANQISSKVKNMF